MSWERGGDHTGRAWHHLAVGNVCIVRRAVKLAERPLKGLKKIYFGSFPYNPPPPLSYWILVNRFLGRSAKLDPDIKLRELRPIISIDLRELQCSAVYVGTGVAHHSNPAPPLTGDPPAAATRVRKDSPSPPPIVRDVPQMSALRHRLGILRAPRRMPGSTAWAELSTSQNNLTKAGKEEGLISSSESTAQFIVGKLRVLPSPPFFVAAFT